MIKDRLQFELDERYAYGDNCVRYTHRLRLDRIQKLVAEISKGHKAPATLTALDAGCCHGAYSIILAEAGFNVLGLDIDEREIRKAYEWVNDRRLQGKINLQVGDVQHLSCKNSTFDLVVCSEVLEHLDDPRAGARELYRVLKPNGRAIISMPNMACLFGLLQWTYRKTGLRSLLGKPPLDKFQIQHSRYWFGNIGKILTDNGFCLDQKCSTSHLPFLWEVDALLEELATARSLPAALEGRFGKLPLLKYFGFNFIVLARKPCDSPP